MTIRQFLTDLAKKQIFVKLSGNNLSIKGHTNDLLLSEKEYLRNNKSRILAFLSKKNISQEQLKNFIGKVIIFSDNEAKGTKLEELTNHTWNTVFMRESHYEEVKETSDHKYLIDWNRRNITKVHPDRNYKESTNYNPNISWRFGCQFVTMNYQHVDNHMKDYILKFNKRSFV